MPEQTLNIIDSIHSNQTGIADIARLQVFWTDDGGFEWIDDSEYDFIPQELLPEIQDGIFAHSAGIPELIIPLSVKNPNHIITSTKPNFSNSINLEPLNSNHNFQSEIATADLPIVQWQDESDGVSFDDEPIDFIPQDVALEIYDSNFKQTTSIAEVYLGLSIELTPHDSTLSVTSPTYISSHQDVSANNSIVENQTESPTLPHIFSVTSSIVGVESGIADVTIDAQLAPSDSAHDHNAAIAIASRTRSLTITETVHTQNSEIVPFTLDDSINAIQPKHKIKSARPILAKQAENVLDIQGSNHSDVSTASINGQLEINAQTSIHSLQNSSLDLSVSGGVEISLSPQNSNHTQTSEIEALPISTSVEPINSQLSHQSSITTPYGLRSISGIEGALNHSADSVAITYSKTLQLVSPQIGLSPETASINASNQLSVLDSNYGLTSSTPTINAGGVSVSANDANHKQKANSNNVNIESNIIPFNSIHKIKSKSPLNVNGDVELDPIDSTLIQTVEITSLSENLEVTGSNHSISGTHPTIGFVLYPFKTFVANDDEYLYSGRSTAYSFTAKDMTDRLKMAA